jgi:hypothetical protein
LQQSQEPEMKSQSVGANLSPWILTLFRDHLE